MPPTANKLTLHRKTNKKRWEKIVLRERSREMGEKRAVVIMSGQVMKKEKIAERVAVSRREITI